MARHSFVCSSKLNCSIQTILATLTMKGVNQELGPLVRMSAPSDWRDRPITDWPPKTPLFRSWILLFGFLPIDRHSFYFESIDPGSGFEEASSSWMNRIWCHSRTVEGNERYVTVTDSVEYEFRLPLVGLLFLPIYKMIFSIRHRYLRRTFGESP